MIVVLAGLLVLQVAIHQLEKAAYPQKYKEEVEASAAEFSVEDALIYAVIRTESGFDPNAVSGADAHGLMQMTEETFDWLVRKLSPEQPVSFADLVTPAVSIRFGTYYLSLCLERYANDIGTAAAAYHSGMGKVDELLENPEYTNDGTVLHTFPYSQMKNYVRKVRDNYETYQTLWGKA